MAANSSRATAAMMLARAASTMPINTRRGEPSVSGKQRVDKGLMDQEQGQGVPADPIECRFHLDGSVPSNARRLK
jgi:hypothetical protein